jgi:hypothetical protein|tara:strand:+ start:57 stop:1046 length:990 start_codon:yes stop_codon:yes gene_type:complete
MIKSRNSEDHLSKEMVLAKIREIDIFSYYCSSFKELGVGFCSELREDSRPSVTISMFNGRLLYKDFGHPDHSFDCFRYVEHSYNCSFFEALKIIDNDFALNLHSNKAEMDFTRGVLGMRSSKKVFTKKVVIIKKKSRDWMKKDAEFWSKYLISKKTLCIFDVQPISHYWINDSRISCNLSYAYKIGTKYKIYSPYEEVKWISNTNKKHIQGYNQCAKRGDLCIITSSLKDVMCLFEMGIPAIALQSEMQMPEEETIKELKTRFKKVAVFYDNDFDNVNNPGQSMASKICTKYHLRNIVIPDLYEIKDPSDYIAHFGRVEGLQTLIKLQT